MPEGVDQVSDMLTRDELVINPWELGRAGECPDQPVPKVTTKLVHGEVEVHGQREVCGGLGEVIAFSRAKLGAGSVSLW